MVVDYQRALLKGIVACGIGIDVTAITDLALSDNFCVLFDASAATRFSDIISQTTMSLHT